MNMKKKDFKKLSKKEQFHLIWDLMHDETRPKLAKLSMTLLMKLIQATQNLSMFLHKKIIISRPVWKIQTGVLFFGRKRFV